MFTKKSSPSEENSNVDAKILTAHILYTRTTPQVYLESSPNLRWSFFAKRSRQQVFQKRFIPDALLGSKI